MSTRGSIRLEVLTHFRLHLDVIYFLLAIAQFYDIPSDGSRCRSVGEHGVQQLAGVRFFEFIVRDGVVRILDENRVQVVLFEAKTFTAVEGHGFRKRVCGGVEGETAL